MRLLQSVLMRLTKTKKPQHKFRLHLFGLRRMLPGQATLRHLSRSRPYQDKTVARWYGTGFDCVSRNKAASLEVGPTAPEQAWVREASGGPTRGTHTSGLERFWHGSPSRPAKG